MMMIGKWPDLRSNFGELYAACDCSCQPAHSAAATAQAALRRFLVQAHATRQRQHMAALHPSCRYTSRALYDRAATTRATADQAALELQHAEAMPHDADAPIAHTAARRTSLRTAAAAAESSSQLASVAETRLCAALLAAQRLLACACMHTADPSCAGHMAHACSRTTRTTSSRRLLHPAHPLAPTAGSILHMVS